MFLYLCVRLNSHLDMEMELNSLNLSTGTLFCVTNQLLKPGKPTSHLFSSFIGFKNLKKWSVNVLQPWLSGYLCFFLITVTHGSLLCTWGARRTNRRAYENTNVRVSKRSGWTIPLMVQMKCMWKEQVVHVSSSALYSPGCPHSPQRNQYWILKTRVRESLLSGSCMSSTTNLKK